MHVKVSKMYCSQRACHVDRVHWHMSSAALSDTTFHNSRQLRVAQLSLNLIWRILHSMSAQSYCSPCNTAVRHQWEAHLEVQLI